MLKFKVFVCTVLVAGLATWGYMREDMTGVRELLLLTAGWFVMISLIHGLGLIRTVIAKKEFITNQLNMKIGLLRLGELRFLTLFMVIFSFICYFTIEPHWILLVHGSWWTMIFFRNYIAPFLSRWWGPI
jgi:hypothetical protein